MPKTIPLSEAKAHLSEIIKDVSEMDDIVTISKGGIPAGVLMSVQEYESLIETLEILSDPDIMEAIKMGLQEEKEGTFLTHDEVWSDL